MNLRGYFILNFFLKIDLLRLYPAQYPHIFAKFMDIYLWEIYQRKRPDLFWLLLVFFLCIFLRLSSWLRRLHRYFFGKRDLQYFIHMFDRDNL